jgi:hypothetical protein
MNHTVEVPAVSPLQSLEMLALRRSVSEAVDKAVAAELSEGTHNIDVTLRLFGTVKKGAPYEQTCPLVIPWQLLFSLAASRLNLQTGASIESIANELMTEADGIMKRDAEAIEKVSVTVKPHVEEACARLVQQTKRPMAGRITTRLNAVALTRGNGDHVTEMVKVVPGTIPTGDDIPANMG